MKPFEYNQYGREQTGFDNSIDHSLFGHWSNPEYQQLCQDAELIDRQNSCEHNNETSVMGEGIVYVVCEDCGRDLSYTV